MSDSSRKYLYPAILTGQLIAGGTFPVVKIALQSFDPFTLAILRFLIASMALLVIVFLTGRVRKIEKGDWSKMIFLGILAVPLNQLLFLYGLNFTTPGRSALFYGVTPIFVFLLAKLFLQERATLFKMLGIVVSFAGVALILRVGRLAEEVLFGDLLVIAAVVAWAAYTVFGKPLLSKYGSLTTTAYALSIGTALYLPFGIYRIFVFDFSQATFVGWLSLLYAALLTSVVAYTIWYWALARLEASKLAIFQNLQPILAAILSVILVGESFGLDFYLGGAMVIGGVFLTQRG